MYFALGIGVLKEIWCSCRKGLIFICLLSRLIVQFVSGGGGVHGMQNPILACVFS